MTKEHDENTKRPLKERLEIAKLIIPSLCTLFAAIITAIVGPILVRRFAATPAPTSPTLAVLPTPALTRAVAELHPLPLFEGDRINKRIWTLWSNPSSAPDPERAICPTDGQVSFNWAWNREELAIESLSYYSSLPLCAAEVTLGIKDFAGTGLGGIVFQVSEGEPKGGLKCYKTYPHSEVEFQPSGDMVFWQHDGQSTSPYSSSDLLIGRTNEELLSNVRVAFEKRDGVNYFFVNDIEVGHGKLRGESHLLQVYTYIRGEARISAYVKEAWVRYCD